MILQGVDRYRVMDPLFEGIRVIMSYRGEPYSPEYIQGISGAAFRIGGICPCAPTCALAMEPIDLIRLLGYEAEHLPLYDEDIDLETEVQVVLERVKAEIRAGRPALLWHAFTTAEWDVIAGYDDASHQLLGRGSYKGLDEYAVADDTRTIRCLDICPAIGAMLVGEKTSAFDALAAEAAALEEAVRHAHSQLNKESLQGDAWQMLDGLLCYDRWIADFAAEGKLPSMGDRYCMGVYRSTHRAAAGFVRELATKYAGASELLLQSAQSFEQEADALHAAQELVFPGGEIPDAPQPETNHQASQLLARARSAYAEGIDAIEESLPHLQA